MQHRRNDRHLPSVRGEHVDAACTEQRNETRPTLRPRAEPVLNIHRRRAIRGIVRSRVAKCVNQLLWVRTLTQNGGLPRLGMTFVFLCPRCAQKFKTKRVKVTALSAGESWQHELPKCEAFTEAFELPRSTRLALSVGWLGAP